MVEERKQITVAHLAPDLSPASGVATHLLGLLPVLRQRTGCRVLLVTNYGGMEETFGEMGIETIDAPLARGSRNPWKIIQLSKTLSSVARTFGIDVLHSHHRAAELAAVGAARRENIATAMTVHSLTSGLRRLSYRSDVLISVSKEVMNRLTGDYRIQASRVTWMYNAVSPFPPVDAQEVRKFRDHLGIPAGAKVLLFAGRICRQKGIDTLISAFATVQSVRRDVFLLLAGTIEDEALRREISRMRSGVLCIPPISESAKLYAVSDLVVLPSRRDSFPYGMLEAGLAHKPLVASSVDGIREFLDDGVDAVLFRPDDARELAHRILYLLESSNLQDSIANHLERKVRKLPSWSDYADRLMNLYRTVLTERSGHRSRENRS